MAGAMNKGKASFSEKCWELISKVPRGRVTTYGEVARALGSKGYRAVGTAMNRNPFAPKVPCHRVVKGDGTIGGYAHGTGKKIDMLRKEGVSISDERVLDFEERFFSFR